SGAGAGGTGTNGGADSRTLAAGVLSAITGASSGGAAVADTLPGEARPPRPSRSSQKMPRRRSAPARASHRPCLPIAIPGHRSAPSRARSPHAPGASCRWKDVPRPMKAVLIGAGAIAREHIGALQSVPGVEVAGICDLSPVMAEATAEQFRIPRWFTDHKKML